ncbi:hypothetical protein ACFQE1_20185, partial [Halobium palmae]
MAVVGGEGFFLADAHRVAMVEPLVLVAFGLLLLGVVGSVVPGLPGALGSLAGVGLYWYASDFGDPSVPV